LVGDAPRGSVARMRATGRIVTAIAIGWLGCAEPRAEPQVQPTALESQQQPPAADSLPSAVLSGEAELHCNM